MSNPSVSSIDNHLVFLKPWRMKKGGAFLHGVKHGVKHGEERTTAADAERCGRNQETVESQAAV